MAQKIKPTDSVDEACKSEATKETVAENVEGNSGDKTSRSKRSIAVAYLGPEGTFSHQAATASFSQVSSVDIRYQAYPNIRAAFDSLSAAMQGALTFDKDEDTPSMAAAPEEQYVVLPIENSFYGPVKETMDCLYLKEVPVAVRPRPEPSTSSVSSQSSIEDESAPANGGSPFSAASQNEDLVFDLKCGSAPLSIRIVSGATLSVRHALLLSPMDATYLRKKYMQDLEHEKASMRQRIHSPGGYTATSSKSDDTAELFVTTANGNGEDISDEEDILPCAALEEISEVASHEQALGQCKTFLSKYLPNAKRIHVASTALAASKLLLGADIRVDSYGKHEADAGVDSKVDAEGVKERAGTEGIRAAIASEFAAARLGVQVARSDIQDAHNNTTRFIVLTTSENHVFR
ncbi:hypothetical protein K437DRAFT_276161 [Tilletiaria anomala UBC 951]|uniref:Prephenate dehydratase domain-containing protein n=1 Tax=Tilletiaria anomala (strain ATCC 24038 / CBS 436.72 / UBC 951) TaxID=1037660 RepID=A0A066VBX3_TILAU|nr:uncharacterized protein K437DRAFT_276161 [Tilletiaria anomala UBC 951]KDN38951.1 hypothetical protein K437DRAFT_276161 [Tilletiaria anomala UBC 951]